MKKKYCVTVIRTGCLFIEAETEGKALHLAEQQKTSDVSWSDDWEATDAQEDDSYDGQYISEAPSLR